MRVLWICNTMLPRVCDAIGKNGSVKEGWISGLLDKIAYEKPDDLTILAAFPATREEIPGEKTWQAGSVDVGTDGRVLQYYLFLENTVTPWVYDAGLEKTMEEVISHANADMIHIFGTEYPHTLAAVKAFGNPQRTLIGIQGLCSVYADAFYANLPGGVIRNRTFRDVVRQDDIQAQQDKYVKRGKYEIEAVKLAGHVAGRTDWDRKYTHLWNPQATYHVLKETLRGEFYKGEWQYETCQKHRIFVSQGNYPIKGLHYVLLALPKVLEKYPDTTVSVAGDCILREGLLAPLKISAYGKYLEKLLKAENLQQKVSFQGPLKAEQMKAEYLKSHIYLCPSSIENSPNSLGEAMVLKTPVVTADVGGIPSMICEDECMMFHGFEQEKEGELERIATQMAEKICEAFAMEDRICEKTAKAYVHGLKNHSGEDNVEELLQVYRGIVEHCM